METLKQLQEFLGTCSYNQNHAGPAYARVADPLRPLLRPGADAPAKERQRKAFEETKGLMEEQHRLAVPAEAATIEAASAWQNVMPPFGRRRTRQALTRPGSPSEGLPDNARKCWKC